MLSGRDEVQRLNEQVGSLQAVAVEPGLPDRRHQVIAEDQRQIAPGLSERRDKIVRLALLDRDRDTAPADQETSDGASQQKPAGRREGTEPDTAGLTV